MTDAAAIADRDGETDARAAEAAAPLRAGRRSDLAMVHARLMEVIATSPYYSDAFKDYERARLTRGWLEALHDADPWHVAIMQLKGEAVGFMISGPELGTLWLYWSYLFPERRKSSVALAAMRAFLGHWQQGRFHKVATYTRPGNAAAVAIMERFGWTRTALLEKHIFGEDYLLYEHALEKVVPGYDRGVDFGRMAQLRRSWRRLLGG